MSKKSFSMVLAAITVVCAFTFGGFTHSENNKKQASPVVQRPAALPEHVPYMFLFQHLNQLSKLAQKQKSLGRDGSGFQLHLRDALKVDDQQFEKINDIARHCDSEVEALDLRAKAIAEAFRAQYPPGIVPEGTIIPPPPSELTALQEMRNSTILHARDRVRLVLGEQEFARFDENVKLRLTPDIKRISSAP